ncbi:NAD(P)H-dependent flavin oxidoreductase [Staphylococcus felis]|uniref:Probable nitronate monooxygenase n=1 Tax=Staphylococcus felis TaxID=46127 RepID=A0A3E0IMN0_9STAP|nr:nitronate monooxygenase [Staphylococcus felis]REH86279.1 nitronate monooxygenase [Staphylococcus felis]REH90240.1 nitronate monooxygenase [Staphylococcus felis]REH92656.1 nitronate monooxygenase [Staphylococcus felis]
MWGQMEISQLCQIDYPIIQAGMAGSTTPELVAAVSNAGALGTIGAGYMTPDELESEIKQVQDLTANPFAINIFVPEDIQYEMSEVRQMNALLHPYRQALGLDVPNVKSHDASDFELKIKLMIKYQVPVCSFTFGIPHQSILEQLKSANVITIGSATTVEEAQALERAGLDIVVAQGSDAGGHRGSFSDKPYETMVGTMSLVPQIVDNVSIPVVAAGGIMDGRGLIASLMLGAQGVQLGTAFLTTRESKAKDVHKKAILNCKETDTIVTDIFSGKMARGIQNAFIHEIKASGAKILPYPIQNDLTTSIRSAASQIGKTDWMHLWSGQGVRLAQDTDAKSLVESMIHKGNQCLNQFNQ